MQMVLAGTAGLAAGGKIIFSRMKRRRKAEADDPQPATPLAEDPAPSE